MKTLSRLSPNGIAGPPSACSAGPGRLDVFAVGTGSMLWHWWLDGAANWIGPAPLPIKPPNFPNLFPQGVCAIPSGGDRIEVFAAGAGNTPWWWRATGQNWSNPITLPGGANIPPVPVAAVCSGPGVIDIFAAGAGNRPWWWRLNPANSTGSAPLPLTNGADIPAERIAAVAFDPDHLHVFAAGKNGNQLWHWWWEGKNTPWRLEPLGGDLPGDGVSAVSWGPGRIDVFAVDRGGQLNHWSSDGAGFNGYEILGDGVAAGTVSALSKAPRHLAVFATMRDGSFQRWEFHGERWLRPVRRGDNLAAGDISAVSRSGGRIDVFASGAGNSLRQWPGGGLENVTGQPWSNFAGNHKRPTATAPLAGHCRPDSLAELIAIVKEAEQLGRTVRAVGSGWSNSDVADSSGYIVDTHALDAELTTVLNANPPLITNALGQNLVHVEAGMKVSALVDLLNSRGLALSVLGGASGQTVAGVISTSVHGSEFDLPPLPDAVRAIHLVGPGGIQYWLQANLENDPAALAQALGIEARNIHSNDEWFNSVLVSMGSMGIIYSVILAAVPQFDLAETCEVVPDWPAMRARLQVHSGPGNLFDPGVNRGVNVVLNPFEAANGTRPCYLVLRKQEPASKPFVGGGDPDPWMLDALGAVAKELFKADAGVMRDIVTAITQSRFPARDAANAKHGWANTITTSPVVPPISGLSIEIGFDATNDDYLNFIDEACEILRRAFHDENLGLAGWFSMRWVGSSNAFLSPQHWRSRTCMVEIAAMSGIAATPILLGRLEAAGRRHHGIQHWGMFEDLTAGDVAARYDRLDTWRKVRWELTQHGRLRTFDNDFTRRCGLSRPPSASDYDADGRTDLSVYRPSTGNWHVINSATGSFRTQQWGQADDVPLPADYDGEGRTDFAVWRPSDGMWHIINSWGGSIRSQQWGQNGDVPVPADYDGDGKTDLAVWRPGNGTWYVVNSSDGVQRAQQFGMAGDIPVPFDADNDGRTDFVVWRPSNGTWYVRNSVTGAWWSRQWGQPGDVPVPGRYDDDTRTDFAVWRPSNGMWYIQNSVTGATRSAQWGQDGDVPAPGDYDHDGRTDLAVWRPATGNWHVVESSTGNQWAHQWGQPGDVPLVRARR